MQKIPYEKPKNKKKYQKWLENPKIWKNLKK
jgi:hypothetical protein